MSTLPAPLRRQLERAALDARNVAEAGAHKALEALAVHEPDPYRHMDEAQRDLRRKLRAQARQMGDGESQTKRGAYEIKHLVEKLAYDQWHRLLFARFLLENNLLISPEHGVSVSLDDCEELAPSLGLRDAWAVAARFAAVELPEIFRAADPAGAVEVPVEDRKGLIQLVTGLPVEVFTASDSLGWCYQFWQAERKDQVNASGNKIGADELPSVTQLFTEDYMVDFLLDNTLGAWWAGKKLTAENAKNTEFDSEEAARQAVALPGCPWKYLRFIRHGAANVPPSPPSEGGEGRGEVGASDLRPPTSDLRPGPWLPAAGTFDGWPKTAKELKCLDPCMGSGHFVVAMFERLVALRMAEEKLDEAAAVAAVIRDNLFGLEIDPRCTQIAAFNLALAAWRRVGHCKLPAMNLACSGLAPNSGEADWLAIVDAASSRPPKDTTHKLEASATFSPINYFRPDEPVANLTGNLPHWRQEGTTYFVTFRCADALPQEKLHQWQQELAEWQAAHPEPYDDATRQEFYERFPQRIQSWLDSGYGECVLREPAMREIVESALRHFDGQRYRLAEFVVAANHVHALVTPLGEHLLSDILHSWKSFTANKINEARKKSGTFWQKESFDHIVRSPASLAKFREYILSHNQVAAASSRTPPEGERLEAAATMRLRAGMERLYRLFKNAPVLGSLINPRAGEGDLLVAAFHELQPLLGKALAQETQDDTAHEMAVTARGLAKAAEILAGQFTLVATNVPYLGREGHSDELISYADSEAPHAAADLATLMVERCNSFLMARGDLAVVLPQNWWVGKAYKEFRRNFLPKTAWRIASVLGEEAWETFGNRGPNTILLIAEKVNAPSDQTFLAVDVSTKPRLPVVSRELKALALAGGHTGSEELGSFVSVMQLAPLETNECRISIAEIGEQKPLSHWVVAGEGSSTGDNDRFMRGWWEVSDRKNWLGYCGPGFAESIHCDSSLAIHWQEGKGPLAVSDQARIQNTDLWTKRGILVGRVRGVTATLFWGGAYSKGAVLICPKNNEHILPILAFLRSPDYERTVRQMDPRVSAATSVLTAIPFDLTHWQKVAAEKYPHGLPKPFSSDPTQWLFNGHPAGADQPLQVAVARLVGYQWPRQTGSSFLDCPALGSDGLEKLADEDGIVPISPAKGEGPAAERLRELLVRAYGKDWNATRQEELLAQVDYGGASLEDWLRNGFFEQHCALFHQRPFIWQVWDGLKNGFSALVNYHKLTHANLEKLTFAYLGDWIRRQQAAVAAEEAGSDAKLQAARQLQAKLKLILEGEPPYDIFVRWKGLACQPIGWNPDLNDGVRMNIRPFATADILRKRVKIKWDKDRGKEPQRDKAEYPWFWGWDEEKQDFAGGREFTGDRWNDCHYSNEFKKKARK